MIFLTSDTHFGHNKMFLYEPRGFTNIQEHDAQIIKNWNEVVSYCDDVYHLGDVMLGDNEYGLKCLKQLNGKIHIICGNHCTDTRRALYENCYNVVEVVDAKRLKYNRYHFILCHYPILTSNFDKPWLKTEISLYGHTHQTSNFSDFAPRAYHVGVDSHDYYPVTIDQVIEDIRAQALNA